MSTVHRSATLHTTTRASTLVVPTEEVWAVVASGLAGPQWYVDAGPLVFRSAVDRLLGGAGARWEAPGTPLLATADQVGFWRVRQADHDAHRLVLVAVLRSSPGEVVISSRVEPLGTGCRLTQTVSFAPSGLVGRVYLVTDVLAREAQMELTHRRLLADVRRATAR